MEEKQLIISVGREYGSAGRFIAEKIAEHYGLPLYDRNILQEIAEVKKLNIKNLEKYDEKPRMRLFSRRVKGYSNSPEENIAHLQFEYLRRKAADGESFVIVGRCGEEVLKEFDCLISIFILGDMQTKIERIAKINDITLNEAEKMILKNNKNRKLYHNHHCKGYWGDSRNYDISINSSKLGYTDTVLILTKYIDERIKNR